MNLRTFVYFLNSVLLIIHEIDSAYWKEWELFRLPGGLDGFLILHIPLVSLIMYGLLEVSTDSMIGSIIYILVALGGLFAFSIHTYFIRLGDEKFRTAISMGLLSTILLVSIIQLLLTRMR